MEVLAAVYRVTDTKSKTEKFGHVWIKSTDQAVMKVREAVGSTEKLGCIWVIEWRNPEARYMKIFGEANKPENDKPSLDIAATLRTMHLRVRGPNKGPKWMRGESSRREQARDIVASALQEARARANAMQHIPVNTTARLTPIVIKKETPTYVPPYTIHYAKGQEVNNGS